jgi:hypothetical protein
MSLPRCSRWLLGAARGGWTCDVVLRPRQGQGGWHAVQMKEIRTGQICSMVKIFESLLMDAGMQA